MEEAVKLARLARYALRRIVENGQRAEAWRKVFSLILRVLHSVLSGEIPLERLSVLNNVLDGFAQDGRLDGGAGSGNWGHAGRPGKRGGSAGGGGVHNRMTAEGGGFTSFSKAQKEYAKPHSFDPSADGQVSWKQKGTKLISGGTTYVYHPKTNTFEGPDHAIYDSSKFKGQQVKILVPNSASPNYSKVKGSSQSDFSVAEAKKRFSSAFNPVSDKEADAAYREQSGKVWSNASEAEKKALHNYTSSGYRSINGALRNNDTGSDYTNGKIRDMTNAISRSKLDRDCIFYRGTGVHGFEKMMKMEKGGLTPETVNDLIGKEGTEKGFMSTGSCAGKGFTDSPVNLEILAPKGTQALYVEPFSACGSGSGLNWDSRNRMDGKSPQSYFSGEQETIIQRSSSLTVLSGKYENGKYHFQAMVTKQDPQNFG